MPEPDLNPEDLRDVADAVDIGDDPNDENTDDETANAEGDDDTGEDADEGIVDDDDSGTRNVGAEKRIQGLVGENAKLKTSLERSRKRSDALEKRQADLETQFAKMQTGDDTLEEPGEDATTEEIREYYEKKSVRDQEVLEKRITQERMATQESVQDAIHDGGDGKPVYRDMAVKWKDTILGDDEHTERIKKAGNAHKEFYDIACELEAAEAAELDPDQDGNDEEDSGDEDGEGDQHMSEDSSEKKQKKKAKPTGRLNPGSRGISPARKSTDKTLQAAYRLACSKLPAGTYKDIEEFKRHTDHGNRVRDQRDKDRAGRLENA